MMTTGNGTVGVKARLRGFWRFANSRKSAWIASLVCAGMAVGLYVIDVKERTALEEKWSAPNRPQIESLDRRDLWPIRDLDWLMQHNSYIEEVSQDDSPFRAATVNTLANAYVLQGEYDLAMPLYEETREMLERFLGPEHPDVTIVERNILLARKLAQHQRSE